MIPPKTAMYRGTVAGVLLMLALLCATTLQAQHATAPGSLLFDDPLTNGKTSAARTFGGDFTPEGWRSTDHPDRLYYLLPEYVRAGRVTFEVRGIEMGNGPARQHIWGMYDVYADRNDPKVYTSGCNGLTLRIYHQVKDAHQPGETRLRADGAKYLKKGQADSPALEWDPDHWYKFEIAWTPWEATWHRDGQRIGQIKFPGQHVVLRHLYVNNDRHHVFDGLKGATYRNLAIYDLTDALSADHPGEKANSAPTSSTGGEPRP